MYIFLEALPSNATLGKKYSEHLSVLLKFSLQTREVLDCLESQQVAHLQQENLSSSSS